MTRSIKYGFIGLVIAFLGAACSKHTTDVQMEKLSRVKDVQLEAVLDSLSAFQFSHFYSRIDTDFKDSQQNVSFKTSVRIKSDSVVNTLITYARIPVVSALITKDSMTVTNKRDKCYVNESLDYIRKSFGVNFEYRNLEELLLGLPVGYQPGERYFQDNDPYSYTTCSHRKREIRKNERSDEKDIITFYTLSNDLTTLNSMRIESMEDTTVIDIFYKEREWVDGAYLPMTVEVQVHAPKNEIFLKLEYKKTRLNVPEQIYFVIPESYERCK